ncbi:MAG: FecR family protein [Prevotellaceae bacterium]|jgi:ferric-dicitrate binding protein FerR (iron transport regulator)|nr:FecR family protein [Prevotellaceae bacterium]
MDINTDIDILLAKYFSGEASANELSMLEDWVAESQENEAYFDEMTSVYQKIVQPTSLSAIDTAKAWNKLEQHMRQSAPAETVHKPRKIRLCLQVAASFAILIAASLFFFLQNKEDRSPIYIASNENSIEHIMPDNSIIRLSENSSITYEQDYGTSNKSILLTGKAFFEIGEDANGKLVVNIGETIIEDIGTVFTVDGYSDNQYISVSVECGIVLFYTLENSGLNLYEGEIGYYNKASKQFSKRIGGKDVGLDQIIFDATPLYKVIDRLSHQFNVTIIPANDSLNSKQITVSFSENEDVEHMLQIVAETLRLSLQHQNGTYILSLL